MTEKRLLWGLGGVTGLVLVAGLVVYVVRGLEDRVTPANFDRIREGMTEREVRAILGRPAHQRVGDGSVFIWVGERWLIVVDLDDRGTVTDTVCKEAEDLWVMGFEKPSVWKKLRGLLPW